jgi:hypothetical protein
MINVNPMVMRVSFQRGLFALAGLLWDSITADHLSKKTLFAIYRFVWVALIESWRERHSRCHWALVGFLTSSW